MTEQVAQASIRGLESGHELITTTSSTDLMTRVVMCSTLGTSIRGRLWKGLGDWLLGSVMLLVMVFARKDMDRIVRNWGKRHEDSGLKRE